MKLDNNITGYCAVRAYYYKYTDFVLRIKFNLKHKIMEYRVYALIIINRIWNNTEQKNTEISFVSISIIS